jgi:hypothetical protein
MQYDAAWLVKSVQRVRKKKKTEYLKHILSEYVFTSRKREIRTESYQIRPEKRQNTVRNNKIMPETTRSGQKRETPVRNEKLWSATTQSGQKWKNPVITKIWPETTKSGKETRLSCAKNLTNLVGSRHNIIKSCIQNHVYETHPDHADTDTGEVGILDSSIILY